LGPFETGMTVGLPSGSSRERYGASRRSFGRGKRKVPQEGWVFDSVDSLAGSPGRNVRSGR